MAADGTPPPGPPCALGATTRRLRRGSNSVSPRSILASTSAVFHVPTLALAGLGDEQVPNAHTGGGGSGGSAASTDGSSAYSRRAAMRGPLG